MANKLADELLREILAPPLRVSDDMFCNLDKVSPFSKVEHSASNVLLVCKRWMRIATPALYHTVVIRSTAQARALKKAVTNHPEFGLFVRKLRLEHSYTYDITKEVIATMPNIEALCVPTGFRGADSPTDIYMLLAMTKPRHLVLVNYNYHQSNVTYRKLLSKICNAISQWGGLDSLTCNPKSIEGMGCNLIPLLKSGIAIRNVILVCEYGFSTSCSVIGAILDQPKLQTLTFAANNSQPSWYDGKDFKNDERALRCLHFAWSDGRVSLHDFLAAKAAKAAIASTMKEISSGFLNPFWRPMERFSREQRVLIWRQIVSYIIHTDGQGASYWEVRHKPIWFDLDYVKFTMAKTLIRVSSELYDATIQTLCEHLSPTDNLAVERLCTLMDRDPVVAGLPKTLTVKSAVNPTKSAMKSFHSRLTMSNVPGLTAEGSGAADIFSRIRHLEQLEVVGTSVAPTSWLSLVSSAVGHSLRTLRIDKSVGDVGNATKLDAFAFFDGLTALETFWWSTEDVRFKSAAAVSASRSTRGLCRLKSITLNKFHQSVTDVLTSWPSLPSLTDFDLQLGARKAQAFIKRHGAAIKHITVPPGLVQEDFDSLKTVQTITLTDDQPADFFVKFKCPSVEEFVMKWPSEGRKWRDRYSATAGHLQNHGAKNFPLVRGVTVGGSGGNRLWPVDEQSERASQWVRLSAPFAAAGVILKDSNGQGWRKRLRG